MPIIYCKLQIPQNRLNSQARKYFLKMSKPAGIGWGTPFLKGTTHGCSSIINRGRRVIHLCMYCTCFAPEPLLKCIVAYYLFKKVKCCFFFSLVLYFAKNNLRIFFPT